MERHSPLTVSEREIEQLDEAAQVALFNDLIWHRALRIAVPLDRIHTTLRYTQPDGGVDAITDLRGRPEDHCLGSELMVWQYKKGWPQTESRSGKTTKLQEELAKDGVQRAFAEGGGYTLVLGCGVPPRGKHGYLAKLETLTRFALGAGCAGQVRLLTADKMSAWATTDPVAVLSLRPEVESFTCADRELKTPKHSYEFKPDDQRTALIGRITTELFGAKPSTYHYRIQGLAGVGKSRLALEVVRHAGLASHTFYSRGVPSQLLFTWVAENEFAQADVVVDECELADALRLEEMAGWSAGRLRLITVGPGTTWRQNLDILKPLDIDAMERVISGVANLPYEDVRWIAEKTGGYVKLAVLVAQAVARGNRNVTELATEGAIAILVKDLLAPTEEGRRAVEGIALLSKVGFRDDLVAEGEAIAQYMGLDWHEMQSLLAPAKRQGILVTRGRY